jgi:hypothetical protein
MSIFTSVFTAVLLLLLVIFSSDNTGCSVNGVTKADGSEAGFSLDHELPDHPYLHRGSGRFDADRCAA